MEPGATAAGAATLVEQPPATSLAVLAPGAAPAEWRARVETATAAPASRRRPTPRAAVLLYAPDDPAACAAQLHAVASAGMPDDVELVIAAGDPTPEVEALLASASGARVLRSGGALGRMTGWQLGAMATRAPHVVALSPLRCRRPASSRRCSTAPPPAPRSSRPWWPARMGCA